MTWNNEIKIRSTLFPSSTPDPFPFFTQSRLRLFFSHPFYTFVNLFATEFLHEILVEM